MVYIHERNKSNLLDLFHFFYLFVKTKINYLNKSMDANCMECLVSISMLKLMCKDYPCSGCSFTTKD